MMQNLKRNRFVSSKLTWGIWRILTQALKNLKHLHSNGLLLNKVYSVWAKESVGEFCLMALNIDATFEGKLTCAFKNDMRNLANFHQSNVRKSENWDFDGILLSKVENVRAQNLQGSFVSWPWRMIQNLKRNWLVSSKLTWGIWQILTRALENPRLLLRKVCNAWTKLFIEELCLMALKLTQNLKETGLCFLKNFVYWLKNSDFIL